MSKELPQPQDLFGFTERELLYDRVSHKRFMAILTDEQTAIHTSEVSSNNYGEFLFVTTSRGKAEKRLYITFYGLGYHDYRERWIMDEWFWYGTSLRDENDKPLPKDEALSLIEARRKEVLGYAAGQIQSERGKLFEMIADLTDEDGALSEMEDLGDLDDLLDDW